VVDTNYTSVAKLRKDWLAGLRASQAGPAIMRGTHDRLRAVADAYRGR
jgi:hypothetical protein